MVFVRWQNQIYRLHNPENAIKEIVCHALYGWNELSSRACNINWICLRIVLDVASEDLPLPSRFAVFDIDALAEEAKAIQ